MRAVLYGHNRTERLTHVPVPCGPATSPLLTIQRCGTTQIRANQLQTRTATREKNAHNELAHCTYIHVSER